MTDYKHQNPFKKILQSEVESHPRIKLFDSNNDLNLYSYDKCNSSDSNFIKKCRGIVFNNNKELILKAFPFTNEYTSSNDLSEQIKEELGKFSIEQCKIYNSYEGTLLRVFYYGNNWYVSTHKKLNAYNSKWASNESFGEIFDKAIYDELKANEQLRNSLNIDVTNNDLSPTEIGNKFLHSLDTLKQYMFLIRNTNQNRIVCDSPDRYTIYNVGTYIDNILYLDDNSSGLPYPEEHSFTNINDICTHVENINYKNLQGLIIFTPDMNIFKIINKTYYDYFQIRGNEPSIKFRYLQIRNNDEEVKKLKDLYPSYEESFLTYESTILKIAQNIYDAYINRYIKRRYTTLPPHEFHIMKECHDSYINNKNNKISLMKVLDIINSKDASLLNYLIRNFVFNQKNDNYKNQSFYIPRIFCNNN